MDWPGHYQRVAMPATTPLLSHRYLRSYFLAPDHLGNRLVGGGEGTDSFVVRGAGWWGVGFCFLGGGWGEGGCGCEKEGRWSGWGGDVVWGSDGVSEGLGGCDGEVFVYYGMDLYRWLGELGRLVFGRCHVGRLCFESRRVVRSSL